MVKRTHGTGLLQMHVVVGLLQNQCNMRVKTNSQATQPWHLFWRHVSIQDLLPALMIVIRQNQI